MKTRLAILLLIIFLAVLPAFAGQHDMNIANDTGAAVRADKGGAVAQRCDCLQRRYRVGGGEAWF